MNEHESDVGRIAVIGMACRFPGAANTVAFWENLSGGVCSITHLTDEQLKDAPWSEHPSLVKAQGLVAGADLFDAPLFGLTPEEARLTDPQQRLFFQCAWEALEHAGYNPESDGEGIGVFAGSDANDYRSALEAAESGVTPSSRLKLVIGNHQDHLTTRLAYLLNLRGPSLTVQTACSSSLVAVHQACQSLLMRECDLALAGGVSLPFPLISGYLYERGGILSPDGVCRAFDAKANGAVPGGGVGIVVLKRLENAIRDRDTIYGVILGSAMNNDGSAKAGYAAPSVAGQCAVIMEAMEMADATPEMVSYVEAHGTGTSLGDAVELEALGRAFAGAPKQGCLIGSVKTNIGHANAAAGVAGLIKTILCLQNRTLVPSLHFETPNPELDLQNGPFQVSLETTAWRRSNRIAGVSSFGIGGANAHIVLGEPPSPGRAHQSRPCFLFTLSAASETALAQKRRDLSQYLAEHDEIEIGDLSFTLNTGRRNLACRQSWIAESHRARVVPELADSSRVADHTPNLVFLIPGQAARLNGLDPLLYKEIPAFSAAFDRCRRILEPLLDLDPLRLMFDGTGDNARQLENQRVRQPVLLSIQYALAEMWRVWGIEPNACAGYSLGELTAACLAGVFSLEDALALAVMRGRLLDAHGSGGMVTVLAEPDQVADLLSDELFFAGSNGPALTVLSGTQAAVARATAHARDRGFRTIRIDVRRPFHSPLLQSLSEPLAGFIAGLSLKPPAMPLLSGITGQWLDSETIRDPGYWADHLSKPIRFDLGLQTLFERPGQILLELGPGNGLSGIAERRPSKNANILAGLAGAGRYSDLIRALGRLWRLGLAPNWSGFYGDHPGRRIALPTYPFEGRAFTVPQTMARERSSSDPLQTKRGESERFFAPGWQTMAMARRFQPNRDLAAGGRWLMLTDSSGWAEDLRRRLERAGQRVVSVTSGSGFSRVSEDRFMLNPRRPNDYVTLFKALASSPPDRVIDARCLDQAFSETLISGFLSSLKAWLNEIGASCQWVVLTRTLASVHGDGSDHYRQAAILGPIWTAALEHAEPRIQHIDLDPASVGPETVWPK